MKGEKIKQKRKIICLKGKTICLQLKNIRQKIAPPNRIKTCFGLPIKNGLLVKTGAETPPK